MNDLLEKRPDPETVYASASGQRIYIEDVVGEEDDDFYLVMVIPYEDKDNMDTAGDELDSQQWVELIDSMSLVQE